MAGHSKWANIQHRKGRQDAKRGKIFTRLIKEITVAARLGGGDPGSNPRLRLAMDKAYDNNMPKDNVERAIKRGTGDLEGVSYEEVRYEGYGIGGAAVMVDCLTDNKTRTVADVRHAFSKSGGNMAEQGAVAWQFDHKAYFSFPSSQMDFDKAFELGVNAGADDVVDGGETIEIYAPVESFKTVADALHAANVQPEESGLRMIAKQEIELDVEDTLKFMKMVESIEDLDDVQDVFHNVKISDEALAALESA